MVLGPGLINSKISARADVSFIVSGNGLDDRAIDV
jgi:hypothetical protein